MSLSPSRERLWDHHGKQSRPARRWLPVLRGAQEGGEARGDRGPRAQAAGLPGEPLHRDREPPGPEENSAPHSEPVLLAGDCEGCGGLGKSGATSLTFPGGSGRSEQLPEPWCRDGVAPGAVALKPCTGPRCR